MRVQTEEWQRFVPGVRMYKGKMTYFYNGEKLYDNGNDKLLIYTEEERQTWKVIMVLPGVEVIRKRTFRHCKNVETVIMSDSVKRIFFCAFEHCRSLEFVRLSTSLVTIGGSAFYECKSLTSIFIPPSCREIRNHAFQGCRKLIILSVPQQTNLHSKLADPGTALIQASHFETNEYGNYDHAVNNEVNAWIKSINNEEEYALHRACSSFHPLENIIYNIIRRQGPQAFCKPNSIGITPSQYLAANPYSEIEEGKLVKRYILEMMDEIV